MPNIFVVREPFTRVNPLTGKNHVHMKGDIIREHERIADLHGSPHHHHVVAASHPDEPLAPAEAALPAGPASENETEAHAE